MKKINRYQLVHLVSQLAKEKEQYERNPINQSKPTFIKTINETKQKRNFVLEAFEEIHEGTDVSLKEDDK